MSDLPDVRAGQVWADNDKRSKGREVTVVEVISKGGDPYAIVEVTRARRGVLQVDHNPRRRTRINVRRFRPNSTGYRLIQDVIRDEG